MLSLIVPAYNEGGNVDAAVGTLCGVLGQAQIPFEIWLVDDGSKDDTFARIQALAMRDSRIHGVSFSRNFGKEAAVFAGLKYAAGDCCVVIDCDLQHPPEKISEMYALWQQGYEVVEGIKAKRGHESLAYKLSAGLFYKTISRLIHIDMASSSDFKLLDRKVVDVLLSLPERKTFFRALSFWAGFKSVKVPFEVAQRRLGKSKWSFASLLKYATGNITSFTAVPLQLVTVLGVLLIVASVALIIQTLVRFFMGDAQTGFTTVILLLLLIGGAIMVSLGIIGHYIGKIYDEIKGRPRYIVRTTTEDEEKR